MDWQDRDYALKYIGQKRGDERLLHTQEEGAVEELPDLAGGRLISDLWFGLMSFLYPSFSSD